MAVLVGTSLVIGSACVFNNYLDRGIDAKMMRTKKRALVSGRITTQNAIIYASILAVVGFWILLRYTNVLTAGVGLVGFVDYIILYGYFKRRSVHGTIVGSVAGAVPPVAGYTAIVNHLDSGALLLFLLLVFWQMPHFYAIAIRRLKDYKAAGLPVLPVKKGIKHTQIQILVYIVGFTVVAALLTAFGYTGYIYLIVMLLIGLVWLIQGVKGFSTTDAVAWARRMFLLSLVVTLVTSVMLSVGALLP